MVTAQSSKVSFFISLFLMRCFAMDVVIIDKINIPIVLPNYKYLHIVHINASMSSNWSCVLVKNIVFIEIVEFTENPGHWKFQRDVCMYM